MRRAVWNDDLVRKAPQSQVLTETKTQNAGRSRRSCWSCSLPAVSPKGICAILPRRLDPLHPLAALLLYFCPGRICSQLNITLSSFVTMLIQPRDLADVISVSTL